MLMIRPLLGILGDNSNREVLLKLDCAWWQVEMQHPPTSRRWEMVAHLIVGRELSLLSPDTNR